MLNFIKKFLKLGNTDSPIEHKYLDNTQSYEKLKKLSSTNNIQKIRDLLYLKANESFINECLNKSITDGDTILFNELFSYKRDHTVRTIASTDILNLSTQSLKYDKQDIFEFLINFYRINYGDSIEYNSNPEINFLFHKSLELNKTNYLQILEKNKLINFNFFIEDIIDQSNHGKTIEKKLHDIHLLAKCFPDKINKEQLFVYACSGGKRRLPNKQIIDLFILLNVDIHCQNGEGLLNAGKSKDVELVKYLLNLSSLRSNGTENPYPIFETKYGGHLSHIASRCAQVRDNDEVIKCFLEHGAYIDVVRYSIDREMYPWIEKYSESKQLSDELNYELKPSTQEIKTKKLKV